MQNKFSHARILALSLALLGAVTVTPRAHAGTITNHSGAICKNYLGSDATLITNFSSGILSSKTSATQVVCPLTRNTSSSNGAVVYVDLYHSGSLTTTCTAFSYDYTGGVLAAVTGAVTGPAFQELALDLTGVNKSNSWSDYSVLCTIPGGTAQIRGVDLLEQ